MYANYNITVICIHNLSCIFQKTFAIFRETIIQRNLCIIVPCRRQYKEIPVYYLPLKTIMLTVGGQTRRQSTKTTTRTNCHIYTLLPPDDGILASPKHVEV
jgi:hypothetical protein